MNDFKIFDSMKKIGSIEKIIAFNNVNTITISNSDRPQILLSHSNNNKVEPR